MTVRPFSIAFVLLSSLHAFAQQNQPSITCPATEQAVREVSHQIWAAFRIAMQLRGTNWQTIALSLPTMAVCARGSRTSCRTQETRRQHPYRYR